METDSVYNSRYADFSGRVLRDMSSAVLVLDKNGRIVYGNRPAAKLFELPENIAPGNDRYLVSVDEKYNDEFNQLILDSLFVKTDTHFGKVKYRAPSGKEYVLRISSSFMGVSEADDYLIVITVSDETLVAKLRQKIDDSAKTFSVFIFICCSWIIMVGLWDFLGQPIPAAFLTHGVEIVGILMFAFIIWQTSLGFKDIGIRSDTPKKDIKEGLRWSACAVVLLCLVKIGVRMVNPDVLGAGHPFVDFGRFGIAQILYVFTAGIQEFLARGVIQGNLRRIVVGKHPGFLANLITSMIFAAMHTHLGFVFMLGAAVLAGMEGILYEKQKSILGVWMLHYCFGVSGTLLWLIDH